MADGRTPEWERKARGAGSALREWQARALPRRHPALQAMHPLEPIRPETLDHARRTLAVATGGDHRTLPILPEALKPSLDLIEGHVHRVDDVPVPEFAVGAQIEDHRIFAADETDRVGGRQLPRTGRRYGRPDEGAQKPDEGQGQHRMVEQKFRELFHRLGRRRES